MTLSQQTLNQTIKQEKDEIEKLKNKLFCTENVIIKKDNTIMSLKRKLEKFIGNEDEKYLNYIEKEIFLVDPTFFISYAFGVLSLKKIETNTKVCLCRHILLRNKIYSTS